MARLLLVDDEPHVLAALKRTLSTHGRYDGRRSGYDIETFDSAEAALERVRLAPDFDLVLSDYRMPDIDGVALLSECRYLMPDAPRLILSGYADLDALTKALNEARVWRFLSKPWHDYELLSAVGEALAQRALLQENQRLADEVRRERSLRQRQETELRRLSELQPGTVRLWWDEDGMMHGDDDSAL